jgi:hypothetical protein
MKLVTKEILKKANSQYKLGSDMNQNIVAKFFDPYGSWTWYLMNTDPKNNDYCWGIVDGVEVEVGSFSISELQSIESPFGGSRIERDKFWKPRKANDVFNDLRKSE